MFIVCFIYLACLVFWLNETNQMNQINQINKPNQINEITRQTSLAPPAQTPLSLP